MAKLPPGIRKRVVTYAGGSKAVTYQAEVYQPGSRKRVTAVRRTIGEAVAWREQTRADIRRGTWRDPRAGLVLFEDWLATWEAARHVEPETAANDAGTLRKHVLPKWAGRPVGSIRRIEVQAWVTGMVKVGVGQPTVAKVYSLFRSVMAAAVEEDMLEQTPCRKITLPDPAPAAANWWTREQVDVILDRLQLPHWRTIAALMVWCGLRWEEAAGLPVGGVNWLRREVTVTQVITRGRRVKKYPKSEAGHRTVPMAGPVAGLLEPQWQAAAAAGHVDGLIWVARDGRPLAATSWQSYWGERIDGRALGRGAPRRTLTAAPVPLWSPHTLRHTWASWLAQAGVPLADIQRGLGHGDPKSTARYAHLCPEHSNAKIGDALAEPLQSKAGSV